jgi:Xaa-Pro aminopeptidase
VRAAMQQLGARLHLISALDDIAYLFNLRGSDISYNPVFLAHALIEQEQATLFVTAGKIDAALRAALAADGVEVVAYDTLAARLDRCRPTARC